MPNLLDEFLCIHSKEGLEIIFYELFQPSLSVLLVPFKPLFRGSFLDVFMISNFSFSECKTALSI